MNTFQMSNKHVTNSLPKFRLVFDLFTFASEASQRTPQYANISGKLQKRKREMLPRTILRATNDRVRIFQRTF